MKKVRFESPMKSIYKMQDNECHFPRPFIERQMKSVPSFFLNGNIRPVPLSNDPVHNYDFSNSSPYPIANKTAVSNIHNIENNFSPSNDLDLSILDSSIQEYRSVSNEQYPRKPLGIVNDNKCIQLPLNVLKKDNDFFLRRENINQMRMKDSLRGKLNDLCFDKENNPTSQKIDMMRFMGETLREPTGEICIGNQGINPSKNEHIKDSKLLQSPACTNHCNQLFHICQCIPKWSNCCTSCGHTIQLERQTEPNDPKPNSVLKNAVNKKDWPLQRIEQPDRNISMDVVNKTKREPTVSDLFKIIKLQNEQLQLLQEKVDKLISTKQLQPITNFVTEHVALETVEDKKMSIGVMTSFEMVRTSTIINKEIVTKNEAQIQCNRSQISIKEVVSKSQPTQINFLDGIPMTKEVIRNIDESNKIDCNDLSKDIDNVDDKTLNEMSLYNVQVDNAITPLMSPDQSLYLDVRDYSDSDSDNDNQSNVGWTYYNKVMSRVNGILHESDMPSSASALYRNTRQKCLQMQIDKTNVSVAKRVTFGDDPFATQKKQFDAAASDTSLKMNQLAAKYLNIAPALNKSHSNKLISNAPMEMSYATRNYMEKHGILNGTQLPQRKTLEIPKFLDITALKQQPKLL